MMAKTAVFFPPPKKIIKSILDQENSGKRRKFMRDRTVCEGKTFLHCFFFPLFAFSLVTWYKHLSKNLY